MNSTNAAETLNNNAEQAQNIEAINAELRRLDEQRTTLLQARAKLAPAKRPMSRIAKIASITAVAGAVSMVGVLAYRALTKTVETVVEGA